MKYVSIDIETSGLDPYEDQILQFGAVIEDTNKKTKIDKLPSFKRTIIYDRIMGQPYAINMNRHIIEDIVREKERIKKIDLENEDLVFSKDMTNMENLEDEFAKFLKTHGFKENKDCEIIINVAGKNFDTFDRQFIEKDFYKIRFRNRSLDPAILYMKDEDKVLPDLQTCLYRAGINEQVAHNALSDAIDVIRLIRKKRWGK